MQPTPSASYSLTLRVRLSSRAGSLGELTMAIGRAGACNAALLAASVLALHDPAIAQALEAYRARQTQTVLDNPDPRS